MVELIGWGIYVTETDNARNGSKLSSEAGNKEDEANLQTNAKIEIRNILQRKTELKQNTNIGTLIGTLVDYRTGFNFPINFDLSPRQTGVTGQNIPPAGVYPGIL